MMRRSAAVSYAEHPIVARLMDTNAAPELDEIRWPSENPEEVVTLLTAAIDDQLSRRITRSHAMRLIRLGGVLAMTRAPEALAPLVRVLASVQETMPDGAHFLRACVIEFGKAAVEPGLALHRDTESDAERRVVGEILASLGIRNKRIFAMVMAEFERDPIHGSLLVGLYGDRKALPALFEAFERHRYDEHGNEIACVRVALIYETVKQLGGKFTADQEDYYRRASLQNEQRRRAGGSGDAVHTGPARPGHCRTQRARSQRRRKQQKASRKRNRKR